jgi:hypothetical protein
MSLVDETTRISLPLAAAALCVIATLGAGAGYAGQVIADHDRQLASVAEALSAMAAVFFLVVDQLIQFAMRLVLGF